MNMKKTVIACALVAGLGFAGLQQASARGWGGGYGGGCACPGYGQNYQQFDEATRAKADAFRNETQELRKQMAMKRAEKMALLNSQTPDAQAVAKVEGELFDLRTEMSNKAKEAGLPMTGMGQGMGFRQMMKGRSGGGPMGYGMGPCFNQQVSN